MAKKEATARIKINKLLEEAGWRFFDDGNRQANIQLEPNVKITESDIDAFGQDFETTKNGFVDFLLLDENNYPLVVLEAKKEEKNAFKVDRLLLIIIRVKTWQKRIK